MTIPVLAAHLAAAHTPGAVLRAGLTGSVASGKSTLAAQLAEALAPSHRVAILPTDGFLRPNAELDAAGLTMRKGYPESYDHAALAAALDGLRHGPVTVPGYSHVTYDIDADLARTIADVDIVIVEGLGLAPNGLAPPPPLDLLLYLDADAADLLAWYTERFVALWRAAEHDPASFYARFRSLDESGVRLFAAEVWRTINLPNLDQHISRARAVADIVVWKDADHRLSLLRP